MSSSSGSPSLHGRAALAGGRYAIRRKLGSGSLGTVYLAFDETSRRLVALKVIRTERLITDAAPRMQDEFRAVASLRHPQIASAYDFGYLESITEQVLSRARGWPLRLRQIAITLRDEWAQLGRVPDTAAILLPGQVPAGGIEGLETKNPLERRTYETLAVAGRPATAEEVARAVGRALPGIAAALRSLLRLEVVASRGRGRERRYWPAIPAQASAALMRVSPGEVRRVHARLAEICARASREKPRERESLARHLLRAGRRAEGFDAALEAAALLRRSGALDSAVSLLEEAASGEEDLVKRLRIAEEVSGIVEEAGDHEKGIAALEPFYAPGLAGEEGIRIRRRLGIHYHRAGRAEEALAVFEEARRLADPARDLEDLIFIDTELAELHIFRGSHVLAEEASRRGLERIARAPEKGVFHSRMEVMLRASLGHIELRRMSLERAREELQAALRLSSRCAKAGDRAIILHNLAIAENQLNDFESSRAHFRQAERLLIRSGERRNVIKIATNLAVIAAKLGERAEAHRQIDRASEILRRYPGQQLEYFVAYSRGIVSSLLGETEAAVKALEAALPLGRKLGDSFLVGYGEVYLAEAHLLSGRYGKALAVLRGAMKGREGNGGALLRRMVNARLALIEALLGRKHRAARALRALDEVSRTDVVLLEAWNDLAAGAARLLSNEPVKGLFEAALKVFRRLRVPPGARFARVALLAEAMGAGDAERVRELIGDLEAGGVRQNQHHLLSAGEPLALAEAHFSLGETEPAQKRLLEASGAIVGSPFLELDWRIELLRARIALRERALKDARRHLHRSLHIRDHVLQLVPAGARRSFIAHPRFGGLAEAAERLQRSPAIELDTERLRGSFEYEGMVGGSPAMRRIFQLIEDLRDQEMPVLITGETGAGKEVLARALHARSSRRAGPFLAVHCGSLPPELFESEVFGYEAGAFTGAEEAQPGLLESLKGGTLLLDEVMHLALESQAKLLHVLESGKVRRLGSTAQVSIDIRFLAATSADLARALEAGEIRRDLYYRLRGMEIEVPPLRDRPEDIPHLARHFLEKHSSRMDRPAPAIETGALLILERHDWPGNVRELETALLRALIRLSPGDSIREGDLEMLLAAGAPRRAARDLLGRELADLRGELEREYLTQLFRRTGGDLRMMMEKLGVKRTKLYAWFRRLGLDLEELRKGG